MKKGIYEAYKSVAIEIKGVPTESSFLTKGTLTPAEFI